MAILFGTGSAPRAPRALDKRSRHEAGYGRQSATARGSVPGVIRTSLGSPSESVRFFDPTALDEAGRCRAADGLCDDRLPADRALHRLPAQHGGARRRVRPLGHERKKPGAGRGCPCPASRRCRPAKAWMPQRSRHRANGAQEGRSERPATGQGQPRPSRDVASTSGTPRAEQDCQEGRSERPADGAWAAPTLTRLRMHLRQPPCRTGLPEGAE